MYTICDSLVYCVKRPQSSFHRTIKGLVHYLKKSCLSFNFFFSFEQNIFSIGLRSEVHAGFLQIFASTHYRGDIATLLLQKKTVFVTKDLPPLFFMKDLQNYSKISYFDNRCSYILTFAFKF